MGPKWKIFGFSIVGRTKLTASSPNELNQPRFFYNPRRNVRHKTKPLRFGSWLVRRFAGGGTAAVLSWMDQCTSYTSWWWEPAKGDWHVRRGPPTGSGSRSGKRYTSLPLYMCLFGRVCVSLVGSHLFFRTCFLSVLPLSPLAYATTVCVSDVNTAAFQ